LDGLAITLDIFIGDTEYLGKGLASTVIKEFLISQFSDVSEVFIDPEKSNVKAAHVYQKVGFRIVGEFIAAWHPVPHHIMKLNIKDIVSL
jgi:RimJ/RimL family protein N-acetyltransferase